MCKSHMCEWVHLCVCTNSKGKAQGQRQWMFKINLGFLNKYTNRTKNRVSAVLSCVGGGFFMCTLKYWGEGELDALGFTTKFRNSISKAHLCPPKPCGCVATPCLAETTHLPVSAQPHHSKGRWGKHVPSHTEQWRNSEALPPPTHPQHTVLSTQGAGAASCTARKSRLENLN